MMTAVTAGVAAAKRGGARQSMALYLQAAVALATSLAVGTCRAEGLTEALVQRFAQSEFEVGDAPTNAPLLPLAWLTFDHYNDTDLPGPQGTPSGLSYKMSTISEGALIPIAIGNKDIVATGEWLSYTDFQSKGAHSGDFTVLSMAAPAGWARQVTSAWQVATFIAPDVHRGNGNWYVETLGGAFARYQPIASRSWIFGAYFDVSSFDKFYTPYLGANFILNERWTLSVILPWPAVTYAPSTHTLLRLGISPAESSWVVDGDRRRPQMSLGGWNLGMSAEQRVYQNFWFKLEAGVSGIRGFTFNGSDWESLHVDLPRTAFLRLSIHWRPTISTGS